MRSHSVVSGLSLSLEHIHDGVLIYPWCMDGTLTVTISYATDVIPYSVPDDHSTDVCEFHVEGLKRCSHHCMTPQGA